MTSGGFVFSDSAIVTSPPVTAGQITSIEASGNNRLRILFNAPLDEFRAEQSIRYSVMASGTPISITTADLLSDERTVELRLLGTLQSQTAYTVHVTDLLTAQGIAFSDTEVYVYPSGTISFTETLRGNQEVPPVNTTAEASGTFVLTASGLEYDITVTNLSGSITAAHFHVGAAGTVGPNVHDISFTGGAATGTWNLSGEHRNMLLDGNIYVNVHTAAYPNGEIRAQLTP